MKQKDLLGKQRLLLKLYSETKTHAIRVCRKFTDEDYVIWLKMSGLQKGLGHSNLCHVAIEKIEN